MPEFRKEPNGISRQYVDFNNVVNGLSDYGIFCINLGIMPIIRILLEERGMWRTTYVVERVDGGYYIPTPEEFNPVDEAISEFLGSDNMSCDLVSALNEIRDAIRSMKPCQVTVRTSVFDGERWAGSTGIIYDKPVTFGGPNDAFATREAFNESLCNKANWLFEGFVSAIRNLSALSLAEAIGGSVGLAVIGVAFMSNPPVATLTALAIAVGVTFALSEFLASLESYLNDNRQEFVCAIYNSDTAEVAYDAIDAIIDVALSYIGLAVGKEAMAITLMAFIDVDTISQAYADGYLPAATDPIECNCAGEPLFTAWTFYSSRAFGENFVSVESVSNNGVQYAGVQTVGDNVQLPFYISHTGLQPGNAGDTFRIYNSYPGAPIWSSDSAPNGEVNGRFLLIGEGAPSAEPFQVVASWGI